MISITIDDQPVEGCVLDSVLHLTHPQNIVHSDSSIDIELDNCYSDMVVQCILDQAFDALSEIYKYNQCTRLHGELNLHFDKLPFDNHPYLVDSTSKADPFIQFVNWLETLGVSSVCLKNKPLRWEEVADFGINWVLPS